MNTAMTLYRRRIIPAELITLKDDTIVYVDDQTVITKWNALKPREDISYGVSAYLLDKGYKISKVFDNNHTLVYWYCDIITHSYEATSNSLTIVDLLIDVLVCKDGSVKVVDLDEVAEALSQGALTLHEACDALKKADSLLKDIYAGHFGDYQALVEKYE